MNSDGAEGSATKEQRTIDLITFAGGLRCFVNAPGENVCERLRKFANFCTCFDNFQASLRTFAKDRDFIMQLAVARSTFVVAPWAMSEERRSLSFSVSVSVSVSVLLEATP